MSSNHVRRPVISQEQQRGGWVGNRDLERGLGSRPIRPAETPEVSFGACIQLWQLRARASHPIAQKQVQTLSRHPPTRVTPNTLNTSLIPGAVCIAGSRDTRVATQHGLYFFLIKARPAKAV